jgi:hypothetical protein
VEARALRLIRPSTVGQKPVFMTFTRGLALGMIVFVMACSARAGGGTGWTGGAPDASTPTDTGSNPAALCTDALRAHRDDLGL